MAICILFDHERQNLEIHETATWKLVKLKYNCGSRGKAYI